VQSWGTPLVGLTALATGLALGWWWLAYSLAGVTMFDTNLSAFKDALTPEQSESILWRHRDTVWWAAAPLAATNAVWVVVSLALLRSRRGADGLHGSGASTPAG